MAARKSRVFLLPALSCSALVAAFGCGGRSITEPQVTTILVTYSEPASFPPPGDPGCTHHNAPSFLASPQLRVGRGGLSWMPPQVRKSIAIRG